MDDPRYRYQPRSEAQRARQSASINRRIGNKPGHYTVYGVQVPHQHVEAVRGRAVEVARKEGGYNPARAFVLACEKRGWRIGDKPWTKRDLGILERRWSAGQSGKQIAEKLNRSRSAVLGKVNRLGLQRKPKGCREVPATMIRPMIVETLGIAKADDNVPEFRTAMILVSPMFVSMHPDQMARWTGYPREECVSVLGTMTRNGIWKTTKPVSERYMKGDETPGLQEGDMSLVLDTLLCLGQVRCDYGGERWFAP